MSRSHKLLDRCNSRATVSSGLLFAALSLLSVSCDTQDYASHASLVVSIGEQVQLISTSGERIRTFGYHGVMPSWTPDGGAFVFIGFDGVMLQQIGAPTPRFLFSAGVLPGHPFPLSDGSVLVQVCPTCEVLVTWSIGFYNASAKELSYLTDALTDDRSPVAAELRESIYFLSDRDTSLNGSQVYRMSLTGSDPVRVSSNRQATSGEGLAISGDEQLLAYADAGDIYILDLDTEQIVDSLTLPPGHSNRGSLSFSPDGDSIAVVTQSGIDAQAHLLLYDLSTKSFREILTSIHRISASWRRTG